MCGERSRQVFFISDRTGITTEALGEALLNQFDYIDFKKNTYPFVDTIEKAKSVVERVCALVEKGEPRPLIFSSIVTTSIREEIHRSPGLHIDFFDTFIHLLEEELQQSATHAVGRAHGLTDPQKYDKRMEAVNFSLQHDDGLIPKNWTEAELILIGVSRSGKTPTCLYLALHYGIKVANYPLIGADLDHLSIPSTLIPYRKKLFGLTINPQHLHGIRTKRRPHSSYAALENCIKEVETAEKIFKCHAIPYLDSTHTSIEELSAQILEKTGLKRY